MRKTFFSIQKYFFYACNLMEIYPYYDLKSQLKIYKNTGKPLHLELVRTEEKLLDVRGFEKSEFALLTIVTPKTFYIVPY